MSMLVQPRHVKGFESAYANLTAAYNARHVTLHHAPVVIKATARLPIRNLDCHLVKRLTDCVAAWRHLTCPTGQDNCRRPRCSCPPLDHPYTYDC